MDTFFEEKMTAYNYEEMLASCGAIHHGHFELSSGLHSPVYVQTQAVLMDPRMAERLANAMIDATCRRTNARLPLIVASPALGAVTLGYEVARLLHARFLFAEKDVRGGFEFRRGQANALLAKDHVEAGRPCAPRVMIVENVVTTGASARGVVAELRKLGVDPVAIVAIVARSNVGDEAFGLPFVPLVRIDAPSYDPVTPPDPARAAVARPCPGCVEGLPLARPGSRT